MSDPIAAAQILLGTNADGTLFLQRPAEIINRFAGTEPGGQPTEQELLEVLVPLEHAIDAAPADLEPAIQELATPLRRFLVAHRTHEVLTVSTEKMLPAITSIFQWASANGFKASGSRD